MPGVKMKHIYLLLILPLLGCRTNTLSDSEANALDTSTLEMAKSFEVPDTQVKELCWAGGRIPGGKYTKKDRKAEEELCSYDFYGTASLSQTTVGVCPKLKNTNPSLEIYKLTTEVPKRTFEANECANEDRSLKKLAKFKTTITCSYTGSIVGYYHFSRLLGNILKVPPSVIRTIELGHFKRRVRDGQSKSGRRRIRHSWKAIKDAITPGTSKHRTYWPLISTTDGKQIFGALSSTVRGEYDLVEIQTKDMDELRTKEIIKKVTSPIRRYRIQNSSLLTQHKDILTRKDVSEMILLDFIFGQQDRGFNIHAKDYVYYLNEQGTVAKKSKKKFSQLENMPANSVAVPRLVLKDNDCGIRSGRKIRTRTSLFYELTHLSRETYKRLMWIAQNWSVLSPLFIKYTTMTTKNISRNSVSNVLAVNLEKAAESLKERCLEGKLHLDLDVNKSQIVNYIHRPEECLEVFQPET